jgi:hypothetical protein
MICGKDSVDFSDLSLVSVSLSVVGRGSSDPPLHRILVWQTTYCRDLPSVLLFYCKLFKVLILESHLVIPTKDPKI